MPELDVVIKAVEPTHAMMMKWHPNLSANLEAEIKAAVEAGQIRHTGRYMQIFDGEQVADDWSNATFALEVDASQPNDAVPLPTQGTFTRSQIPGAQAATIVVHGREDGSPQQTHALLNRWAVEHGYQLCGESRVIYHRGPMHTKDRKDWILEVQAIVEPRT